MYHSGRTMSFPITALGICYSVALAGAAAEHRSLVPAPFVVTQLAAGTEAGNLSPRAGGMLRADYGEGARIICVFPDATTRVLTAGFHSACEPDVSFDGDRILFAGKRKASDPWNVFEMARDGSTVRQVTREIGDCRSPGYQPTLYTIVSTKPWYQLTFVGTEAGAMNEYAPIPATNLYSCKLDGTAARRLTYNLSSDMDPFIMQDGRLLFASWQRARLNRGLRGRIAVFGINIDGADYALYCGEEGKRIKHMPCATTKGLVVFVEAETVPWDGAGTLGCVTQRRPLHSYRPITERADGLFHSPSPLPDGTLLVSRRPAKGGGTHAVCRLDPSSGEAEVVFDDPAYHDIQSKLLVGRPEPDGRSSVVTEKDPHGKLYCLNVNISDLPRPEWMPPGTVKRLRVIEGLPPTAGSPRDAPPLAHRRLLGEIDVEEDGSFNLEVPGSIPIELQTLDADGMALRSCGWIWAKNHEPRGCIGCHEHGELTPQNLLNTAVTRRSIQLCLPPERRRTVDFRRDVMPIIATKCAACHEHGETPPQLPTGSPPRAIFRTLMHSENAAGRASVLGKYVHPGQARTSPLIWHIFGRNTSRPWDGDDAERPVKLIPATGANPLTGEEKRTFVEWIDLGALWSGIPCPTANTNDGGEKE